eukprot:c24042_g1_i1 orf=214-1638(+)
MRDGQGCLMPVLGAAFQPHLPDDNDLPYLIAVCASKCGAQADVIPAWLDTDVDSMTWDPCKRRQGKKRKRGTKGTPQRKKSVKNDEKKWRGVVIPVPSLAKQSVTKMPDGANCQDACEMDDKSFLPGLDDETALRCLAFVSRSDLGSLALVSKRYLRVVRSPLLYQLRRLYGVVEQWVYMYASATAGWTAFDPKRKLWMSLPSTNADPSFEWSDRESLSAGTHLLWLGKEIFNFVVYRYDLVTNSWGKGPAMNTPRCLFASASNGEFAFVAGGFGEGAVNVLTSAERYDSRLGRWDQLPDMHIPRHKSSGCYMDGKFYVIGGKDANHEPVTSGEVYDPITKTWKIIPEMYPTPPFRLGSSEPSPPLVAVVDNRLYAIENSINCVKVYEKDTNTWRILGPLPVRADFNNGWGLAFKALGDELFVIGGYRDSNRQEEIAVFSWRPRSEGAGAEWKLVTVRSRGRSNFLYNCAVMAC